MPIIKDTIKPEQLLRKPKVVERAVADQFTKLVEEIKEVTPVETGNLKSSIGYINRSSSSAINFVVGTITPVSYAREQHEEPYEHKSPTISHFIQIPFENRLDKIRRAIIKALA